MRGQCLDSADGLAFEEQESLVQMLQHRLPEDAFHPQLKTHKLKRTLMGSWARSAGYIWPKMKTVEAIIETNGEVHLIEPLQVTTPRRALVTILEEAPTVHDAAGTCPLGSGRSTERTLPSGRVYPERRNCNCGFRGWRG